MDGDRASSCSAADDFAAFFAEPKGRVAFPLVAIRARDKKHDAPFTMDADRWLIVMDSPVPLGLDYVRMEAA